MKTAKKPPRALYAYDFSDQKFRFRWPDALKGQMPAEMKANLPHRPQAIDPQAAIQYRTAQEALEKVLSRARNLLNGPCEFILVDELLDETPTARQGELFE